MSLVLREEERGWFRSYNFLLHLVELGVDIVGRDGVSSNQDAFARCTVQETRMQPPPQHKRD